MIYAKNQNILCIQILFNDKKNALYQINRFIQDFNLIHEKKNKIDGKLIKTPNEFK